MKKHQRFVLEAKNKNAPAIFVLEAQKLLNRPKNDDFWALSGIRSLFKLFSTLKLSLGDQVNKWIVRNAFNTLNNVFFINKYGNLHPAGGGVGGGGHVTLTRFAFSEPVSHRNTQEKMLSATFSGSTNFGRFWPLQHFICLAIELYWALWPSWLILLAFSTAVFSGG